MNPTLCIQLSVLALLLALAAMTGGHPFGDPALFWGAVAGWVIGAGGVWVALRPERRS